MFLTTYKTQIVFLMMSTLLLCQCTTAVNSPIPKKKGAKTSYSMPAKNYLSQAKTQEGNQQHQSLLKAASRLIYEGHLRQSAAILTQTQGLTAKQANQKRILLAKIELLKNRTKAARAQLEAIPEVEQLPINQRLQYHELLAKIYHSENNSTQTISERIILDSLLTNERQKKNNQSALWVLLTNMPQSKLNELAEETKTNPIMQGWLQLQVIARTYRTNPESLLNALNKWQAAFIKHPANDILPNPLNSITSKLLNHPKKIALLLPLSGVLSGPGKAIQQGFMDTYQASPVKESIKVTAYDTNKTEIKALHQKAIDNGADYIVGPLTKSDVAVIAAVDHPVPTLLLNDTNASSQDNFYLFGLSPANEATQVAIKARSNGHSRVLIISPNEAWGQEVIDAFTTQWKKQKGQVVDTLLYAHNDELNQKMSNFLHITDSLLRQKKLIQALGPHIQSWVSRRQDFDVIFILAYPSKARQIMPLLNYYYAGGIPVYATSSVYAGNANALKDKDLDGLIFCDIPWVFSHQMGVRNWPEQFNSYNRLYALGKDSYALATQLNQLLIFPADGSMKTSGTLYLKPSQQVTRILEWGQFKQGLVHSLGHA